MASAGSVPVRLAAPKAEPAASAAPPVATGSTEPIRPVLVKTLTVRARHADPRRSPPCTSLPRRYLPRRRRRPSRLPRPQRSKRRRRPRRRLRRRSLAPLLRTPAPVRTAEVAPLPAPVAAPAPRCRATAGQRPALAFAPAAPAPAKPQARSGWIIQVGAFPAEQEAKQRLSTVQSKAAKVLAGTDPFTESVLKGGTTYYRARFAGFDQDKAEAACKYLKRNDVDCISVRN